MFWAGDRRGRIERVGATLGWVVLVVLAGFAVSGDQVRSVGPSGWQLVLDVAVGAVLGGSGLVSPGAAAQRALLWSVGAAWLLASTAPVATLHQALLVAVVALFPTGRPTAWRQGAALVLAAPVLLGVGAQVLAGVAVAAAAAAGATSRSRAAPAWWFPALAGSGVGGLLVVVGVVDALDPTALDPSAVLLAYESALVGVAVLHVVGMRAVVDEPARRVRGVLVAHRYRPDEGGRHLVVEGMLAEVLHDPGLRLVLPEPTGPQTSDRVATVPMEHGDGWRVVVLGGVPVAAVATSSPYVADPLVGRALDEVLALVARSLQLAKEREGHLEELRAARSRLVAAVRLEREQLARSLQDTVLPELDQAVTLLARVDPGRPGPDIGTARSELVQARQDIAALVNGSAPMVLGGGRLVDALTGLVRAAPGSVQLEVHGRIAAAPDVEAGCYHVCAEALANVGKHAHADRVLVRVAQEERAGLSVTVTDDGRGGADPDGAGLAGLRDRVRALGGALAVTSPQGAGTVVSAAFPPP